MLRIRSRPRRLVMAMVAGLVSVAVAAEVTMGSDASAQTIDEQSRRVSRLADQLERLEDDIERYAEDYAAALDEQARLDEEIAQTTARIGELEILLDELQGDLAAVALAAFVSGGGGTLTALLTSTGGLGDSVQRQHLTRVALDAGVVDADEMNAVVNRLATERRALARAEEKMSAMASKAEAARRTAEAQQADYRRQYQQAKTELGQLIVAERARRERERLAEAQRQAEAYRRAQQAAQAARPRNNSTTSRSVSLPNIPPPSTKAGIVVNAALSQLGVPYRFATSTPGVAFDCSGLTKWAWGLAGVPLPHQSRQQFRTTRRIPKEHAQPGDLIYYHSPISHVAIYLGEGRLIHAPATGDVVKISAVNWGRVVGVTRPG